MTEGPSSEMAYAVQTKTCTYLLDEDGVCRWVMAPQGVVPAHIRKCIGAQFVAGLDLRVEDGLTGALCVGSRALFVRHTGTHMILLRTGVIEHVDDRRRAHATEPPPPAAVVDTRYAQYGKRAGRPTTEPPSYGGFGVVKRQGDEATVTVSLPDQSAETTAETRITEEPNGAL